MRGLMLLAALTASGACASALPDATWFQTTEQELMDAIAPGNKAVWERMTDPSFVLTSEEGEVLTRTKFLDGFRPLPPGLSGIIKVTDLTVQGFTDVAVVRYLADESESVFGQHLHVQYRVTDTFKREGHAWKMVASHLSVITRDPPAQPVSHADWPGLVGTYRLQPDGWTFTVARQGDRLMGGRDPAKLRPMIPLTPHAFVITGQLGEWLFVMDHGNAARIVNLRKFAPLVWERVTRSSTTPRARS